MKTAIIIPNWNGLDYIEECLHSLAKQTQPHTVIVVDNGSTDGSMEIIRDKFPRVQLLAFPNNAGFTGGVNRGLSPALKQDFDYLVLFNNDAIAQPDWLEHLVATANAHPEAGIITSKIRHMNDPRLDSTGDFYSTWGFPFPRGRDEVDKGQYDAEDKRVVFSGSGGASLYRAEMLQDIGLFDERFFAYGEDVDVSFRAQLAGWRVRYEPAAIVLHHIGGTSRRANSTGRNTDQVAENIEAGAPSAFARYHSVKNFAYLYTKNMPGLLYWKYLPLWWAAWLMMLASDVKRGLLLTNIKGNFAALWHLPGILADRWRIQHTRTVTASYINSILYHDLPPLQKLRFQRFRKRSTPK